MSEAIGNLSRKEQVSERQQNCSKRRVMPRPQCAILPNCWVLKLLAFIPTLNPKRKFYEASALIWRLSSANRWMRSRNRMSLRVKNCEMGIIGHIQVMAKDLTASAVFMNEHRHLSEPYLRDFLLLRINYINRFKSIFEDRRSYGRIQGLHRQETCRHDLVFIVKLDANVVRS